MSLSNPNKPVTEERLSEFYQQILPYLGGMPEILANKFSRTNLYSTNEKVIGQWIDGKPIYQKTIYSDVSVTLATGAVNTVLADLTVLNIDRTLSLVGNCDWNTAVQPIPISVNNGSVTVMADYLYEYSDKKLYFRGYRSGGTTAVTNFYAVIQYTKTTDSTVEIGVDTDYSTTEKIIGTWINGKPLYQKTFVSTMPTTSANGTQVTKYIEIGASVDTAVLVQGFSKSTNAWQTFPRIVESINTSNNKVLFNRIAVRPESAESNKNTVAVISNMVDSNKLPCHVTIQYTKTTD